MAARYRRTRGWAVWRRATVWATAACWALLGGAAGQVREGAGGGEMSTEAPVERYTVDRIEEGLAVLLPADETGSGGSRLLPVTRLPRGVREGHILRIRWAGEDPLWVEIDHEASAAARDAVRRLIQKLAQKGQGKPEGAGPDSG